METRILNYRIIVDTDVRTGGKKACFTAQCPTLGIADSGDTIEEALKNIKKAIEVWIEVLTKDGEEVTVDHAENSFVTFTKVKAPYDIRIASV